MNKEDILKLFELNKNERGLTHWQNKEIKSYGMGLTQIKKLAKQVGKSHDLALELWNCDVYEAKVMATLIDEPAKVTREQVKRQVQGKFMAELSHCYVSYLLSRLKWSKELAEEWSISDDHFLKKMGWNLYYHLAKNNKKLSDDYFMPLLNVIEKEIQSSENFVKDAMNGALLMIGQYSPALNKRAIEVARNIGKIEVDYGDNSCQAPDCVKHLTGERVQEKMKKMTSA